MTGYVDSPASHRLDLLVGGGAPTLGLPVAHSELVRFVETIAGDVLARPLGRGERPSSIKESIREVAPEIGDTVHDVIASLDYDGMAPYIKFCAKLDAGESLESISLDSAGEDRGTTCVGNSRRILKALREKEGIVGMMAILGQASSEPFQHACVVLECLDGYIFIEPHPVREKQIFTVPFSSTIQVSETESITAGEALATTPIIRKYSDTHKEEHFVVNLPNADTIVLKQHIFSASKRHILLVAYDEIGAPKKFIGINLTLGQLLVRKFIAARVEDQTITFSELRDKERSILRIREFMGSDFHVSPQVAIFEIYKIASRTRQITEIFLRSVTVK